MAKIQTIIIFSSDIGMESGLGKYASLVVKGEKNNGSDDITLPGDKMTRNLEENVTST